MIPKSKEEYIEIATKNFEEFFRLYKIKHPYKDIEEEIFKNYYEDDYIFNYFDENDKGMIIYAKKSFKVLLNTLKLNSISIYYLYWFDNEAFNDEVIRYIDENDMIDNIFLQRLMNIPELIILKIKKHRDYIFQLSSDCIDNQIIAFFRSINFKSVEIDDYINKTNLIPSCLLNSKFILYLLEESIDNIKYFKGKSPSDELIQYLIDHNYEYRLEHNISLLKSEKMLEEIIRKGNINIILENDVEISSRIFDILMSSIINNHYDLKEIKNSFLLNNEKFAFQISKYLNISNPYNIEYRYLISNLGRALERLRMIFSDNDMQIIIREVLKNDYYINMIGIIDNIDLIKLKEIYDKLYKKESKFNSNFNFYFFIKIMNYFSNNLSLIKELNNCEMNDCIIDNLSLVINNNEIVNLNELENFIEVYKKRISSNDDLYREKIFKLLINKTNNINKFVDEIIDIPQLIYLQLEFPNNSIEYQILESYIEISQLLKIVLDSDIDDLEFIYNQLIDGFIPNSLFDFNVIKENILRLYARIYFNMGIDNFENYEIINGKKVFDITGLEFVLYSHNANFQIDDDFTGVEVDSKRWQSRNYLCCEFASDLSYQNLYYNNLLFYDLNNPNSLIAFGNRDIFIDYTEKPLINSNDRFVNPYDMAYFQGSIYARTEFDFLRVDDNNELLNSKYIIVKNKEEALKYVNSNTNKIILIFDKIEHERCLINEMNNMLENIKILNYKKLYRLIVLIAKFSYNNYDLLSIQERINELSDKEQIVLNDALNKYGLIDKIEKKVK